MNGQVNVEYLLADSHSFTLDEPGALATFFGEGSEDGQHCRAAISRTAMRLATVFATMKVPPHPPRPVRVSPPQAIA